MPELPEVEATVNYLRERVEGCIIVGASVSWFRSVSPTAVPDFEKRVLNTRIGGLFRRGKYVGMSLDGTTPLYLFTHLRMSGSLDVVPTSFEVAKHDRVCLDLDNGKSIRFNDTRKFGRMRLCVEPDEVVGDLGLEPLGPEFTPEALEALLLSKRGRIKPLLLDQRIIAGLGNIYVDEVLWKTKIHPLTLTTTLSSSDIRPLHRAIQETLEEAIQKLGTDFGDGVVDGGMYRPRVYGRTGRTCSRCKDTIRRIVVGQRGTHLCPTCQKKRRARLASKRKHK
jgi:formamidopyrimidine-DNA glycosylase